MSCGKKSISRLRIISSPAKALSLPAPTALLEELSQPGFDGIGQILFGDAADRPLKGLKHVQAGRGVDATYPKPGLAASDCPQSLGSPHLRSFQQVLERRPDVGHRGKGTVHFLHLLILGAAPAEEQRSEATLRYSVNQLRLRRIS